MGKSRRKPYGVRIRLSDGTKINKVYLANSSQNAASQYKGSGEIIWAQKMNGSRLRENKVIWDTHDINKMMADLKEIARTQTTRRQEVLKDIREHAQEVSKFIFTGDEIAREIRRSRRNKKGGYNDRQE